METKYKNIADEMKHEAIGMITGDQYEKCKEAISKYMDLISRITYVSSAMPISETTMVGGLRCNLVMELGEILCRKLKLTEAKRILSKLGISGVLSNSYAWSKKAFIDSDGNEWEGGQIDLIIDRNDDIMNLCEMKYSSNELFSISPKYAKDVRDRMAMFRASEKTRKDLRCTFVTVYGVKQNPNSDIVVDQVILDDLFT